MKHARAIVATALALAVSGCATYDNAGHALVGEGGSLTFFQTAESALGASHNQRVPIRVVDFTVSVPEALTVSEANRYYPPGDIVWRGEAPGDRHQQVMAIFEDALKNENSHSEGGFPATLNIEVERFHSLTEKARYTVGGVHSIRFVMTLRDATTGQTLTEPKKVKADLKAFGGQRALDAERLGQTQRVRIVAHLSEVFRAEFAGSPWQIQ